MLMSGLAYFSIYYSIVNWLINLLPSFGSVFTSDLNARDECGEIVIVLQSFCLLIVDYVYHALLYNKYRYEDRKHLSGFGHLLC